MNIFNAKPQDFGRWDEFVISQHGGPYQLIAWKEAIERVYHHNTYYLIAEDDSGYIQGILPLVLVKPPFIRANLVSLPFCDYGGVLSEHQESIDLLLNKAHDLARNLNAKLEIRCRDHIPSLEEDTLGTSTKKSRMLLDLPDNSELLWNSFKTKLRTKIRKPQKQGFEFKIGSSELVDDFYKVFSVNMRALGSPVHSKSWITAVITLFGSKAHVGVVYDKALPIAAGIVLECGDILTNPWASALDEYNTLRPNVLLYWRLLEQACDWGFKRFDFGRSTPGEGTYVFKEQWGASPFPLYWYGEGFTKNTSSEINSKTREIIIKTWSKLPQRLVDTIGPLVRKYITL